MTEEQKALKACVDYALFTREIASLKKVIGNALSKCPGVRGELQLEPFIDRPFDMPGHDDTTHLKDAYTPEQGEGDYDRWGSYLTDAQVRKVLAICPHCVAAHEAIQARKAARRSLGAAKRQIGLIGRKAAAQA